MTASVADEDPKDYWLGPHRADERDTADVELRRQASRNHQHPTKRNSWANPPWGLVGPGQTPPSWERLYRQAVRERDESRAAMKALTSALDSAQRHLRPEREDD